MGKKLLMFLMEGILEDVLIVSGPVFVFIAFATKELPNLKCVGTPRPHGGSTFL